MIARRISGRTKFDYKWQRNHSHGLRRYVGTGIGTRLLRHFSLTDHLKVDCITRENESPSEKGAHIPRNERHGLNCGAKKLVALAQYPQSLNFFEKFAGSSIIFIWSRITDCIVAPYVTLRSRPKRDDILHRINLQTLDVMMDKNIEAWRLAPHVVYTTGSPGDMIASNQSERICT